VLTVRENQAVARCARDLEPLVAWMIPCVPLYHLDQENEASAIPSGKREESPGQKN